MCLILAHTRLWQQRVNTLWVHPRSSTFNVGGVLNGHGLWRKLTMQGKPRVSDLSSRNTEGDPERSPLEATQMTRSYFFADTVSHRDDDHSSGVSFFKIPDSFRNPSAEGLPRLGHRTAFDRMTFRQRLMVSATDLDLTTELLGEEMFAPLLVGPVSAQREYHPEGELETARGASAAKTVMVVSSRSSYPFDQISAQATVSLWFQVYADGDTGTARRQMRRAIDAGAKAICITVDVSSLSDAELRAGPAIDWDEVERLREGIDVPVLVKGIMTAEDARTAVRRGLQGIVVSNHGVSAAGGRAPVERLTPITEAVGGQIPVLVDGSFRRGTDILKALALGARSVLLGRPPMWGLSAYGADSLRFESCLALKNNYL